MINMERLVRYGILVWGWLTLFFIVMGYHGLAILAGILTIGLLVLHVIHTFGWAKIFDESSGCKAYGDPTSGMWFPDPQCSDPDCPHRCLRRTRK